ncbi:MAG TPA: hypothetical protein VN735_00945 [Steroidobacteraceae bacterium]|nr:hypothetical protein [Steroidobacteraceae bacterium]
MSATSETMLAVEEQGRVLLPALVGGLAAATCDAAAAFLTFGWGMPRGIASGLLGASAFKGGAGVWLLGLAAHYSILIVAALIYGAASRRLPFLRVNFIVCGLFYGIAIYLVMNLIVLPLSAVPFPVGPFTVATLRHDIIAQMLLVGMPIALSFRLLSSRPARVSH